MAGTFIVVGVEKHIERLVENNLQRNGFRCVPLHAGDNLLDAIRDVRPEGILYRGEEMRAPIESAISMSGLNVKIMEMPEPRPLTIPARLWIMVFALVAMALGAIGTAFLVKLIAR